MAVKIFRLASGEIVMGDEMENETREQSTRVKHPVCLVLNNANGVMIALWLPHDSAEPVTIFRQHIVAEALAARELANEYREKFSGIVTAPASILESLGGSLGG